MQIASDIAGELLLVTEFAQDNFSVFGDVINHQLR